MPTTWRTGNAYIDGTDRRGWLVGHFYSENGDPEDLRVAKDVEIKWATHSAGEERPEWSTDEHRTTVLLLIKGHFQLKLAAETIDLVNEGDYVMWGPGTDHWWRADTDSTVLTIRWPSLI